MKYIFKCATEMCLLKYMGVIVCKFNKKEKIPPTPPKKEKINKKEKGETFFLSEGKVDIVLTILPIRMRVLVPSEPY